MRQKDAARRIRDRHIQFPGKSEKMSGRQNVMFHGSDSVRRANPFGAEKVGSSTGLSPSAASWIRPGPSGSSAEYGER